MTMTPALGALAQASDALTRAIADPQSGAQTAVATTVDLTILILGPIVGALVGVVVSVVLSIVGRKALAKSAMASSILARVRRPGHFTFAAWGAWIGLGIALVNPHLSDWEGSALTAVLMRMFLIIAIGCLTWMGYAAAWVFEDAAKARQNADQGRSRRFETRAQVLRRFTQGLIVLIGVAAAIGTFEAARHAMTTILASAGVISVIFGLAAQQTLGNVFAGMQLAFTDAIRVGDVVVAGEKKETGSVEEITLSYVVVHIWDERRLIVPCRYFTQTPFENWTRRASAQLGTVELKLDWSAPMALIRAKVEQLLNSTDLWDGRTWGVQVTDSTENTVTVRVLVSAKNSGHLSDLRAYMREQLISWIVAEQPWARPVQRIEPRQTVTVEQDMSQERIARLAAELAGISGTNEAGAAPGATAPHAGSPASAGEQSGAATGGAASAISASGAAPAAPKDPIHAARMVAARRKAKRARRRAMADRQRELAEGGPSASRDETQVISKSALRKIIEAAGNASPQLTQTLTATSVGRGERFFSGSAEAEERAAVLEGPGEEAYAEREAEARRAKERREAHKRREAEALDPETTLALAAVGVEPVAADSESPEATQDVAPDSAAPDSAEGAGVAAERADDAPVKDAAADSVDAAEDAAVATDEKAETEPEAADSEADSQSDAGASADSVDSRAAEAQEDSVPAEDAEREDAPAPDAPEETGGEEEAQASSDVQVSRDEQETTPIPARETSVKHPVQVPPPVRTGRPVMTDTVQAIAPALVPPPAPTPAEMAASHPSEDETDEPAVHPGWYAVAEEARLDAETRPTPTVQPARVSIMDFFPAVAPTGAEADTLRAVTGQIPAVEPRAPQAEDAESAAVEKAAIDEVATDETAAPESAAAEEPTPGVEAPEVEATVVMDPVEAAETGALNSDATQVLPTVDEPVDETLVMPAAEEEAPAKKETAKKETANKAASSKAGAKKAPAKKTATKKASTAKKGAKKSSASATKTVKDEDADKASDATPAKKAATKKPATKKPAAKKDTAKKAAPKKAAAKKTSNAGPATNE